MDDLLKQAILLAIAEETKEARAEPKGFIYPISMEVTSLTTLDFIVGEPHTPLFSITLYNDGQNDVYVGINSYQKTAPLRPEEYLNVEFKFPIIKRLYLDVNEGEKAYIRGFGIY
jgi:hypothetical protein